MTLRTYQLTLVNFIIVAFACWFLYANYELLAYRKARLAILQNSADIQRITDLWESAHLDKVNPSTVLAEVRELREDIRHHVLIKESQND